MKSLGIVVLTAISISCGLSTRAEDLFEPLKADLNSVRSDIQVAQTEDARYTGGLVKALISVRIGILRQTEAMLQQKVLSLKAGAPVRYTIDGKAFSLPVTAKQMLLDVEDEINASHSKIQQQESKVAQYSGGLVQAMSLATLETMRQTYAMLEQKRVSLKYGLPQYIGFADANSNGRPFNPPPTKSQPTGAAEKTWSISGIDSRVTESNDVWWKYAWKLTLRNASNETRLFGGRIEFQDADGFIIDTSDAQNLVVPPNEERVFTGYALIRTEVAHNVARTNAKISIER